jgi:hypothetical protein
MVVLGKRCGGLWGCCDLTPPLSLTLPLPLPLTLRCCDKQHILGGTFHHLHEQKTSLCDEKRGEPDVRHHRLPVLAEMHVVFEYRECTADRRGW